MCANKEAKRYSPTVGGATLDTAVELVSRAGLQGAGRGCVVCTRMCFCELMIVSNKSHS